MHSMIDTTKFLSLREFGETLTSIRLSIMFLCHIACIDDMNWSFYAGDSKMNLVELFPEFYYVHGYGHPLH